MVAASNLILQGNWQKWVYPNFTYNGETRPQEHVRITSLCAGWTDANEQFWDRIAILCKNETMNRSVEAKMVPYSKHILHKCKCRWLQCFFHSDKYEFGNVKFKSFAVPQSFMNSVGLSNLSWRYDILIQRPDVQLLVTNLRNEWKRTLALATAISCESFITLFHLFRSENKQTGKNEQLIWTKCPGHFIWKKKQPWAFWSKFSSLESSHIIKCHTSKCHYQYIHTLVLGKYIIKS